MFEVNKFASGEYDVALSIDKTIENYNEIVWDWFTEPDIMIPMMKADAMIRKFGKGRRNVLYAPYLPYARQDRVFNNGQSLPIEVLIDILKLKFDDISTMGMHSYNPDVFSLKIFVNDILKIFKDYSIVYPDEGALNHFDSCEKSWGVKAKSFNFRKKRDDQGGVELEPLFPMSKLIYGGKFIILDDICSGGRTFIKCAEIIKKYNPKAQIELLVYNAFLDRGTDHIIKAGISKIHVINKYSYAAVSHLPGVYLYE